MLIGQGGGSDTSALLLSYGGSLETWVVDASKRLLKRGQWVDVSPANPAANLSAFHQCSSSTLSWDVSHHVNRNDMVLHGAARFCMALRGAAWRWYDNDADADGAWWCSI